MTLTLEIPDPLAEELRRQTDKDISHQFIEAWAAEAYRLGRASTGKLARLLGMERVALTRMLGEAGVYPGTSGEDVEQDATAFDRLLGPVGE
jgi:predicted HTH domain antitoxin